MMLSHDFIITDKNFYICIKNDVMTVIHVCYRHLQKPTELTSIIIQRFVESCRVAIIFLIFHQCLVNLNLEYTRL